jgi:2-dehydro-3-deoxyphosphooctonate aldolase (KDO 8-P synthase)
MDAAQVFGARPFLIAGPCVVEDDRLNVGVGERLAAISQRLGIPVLYKASFDKANRSRLAAGRGPGMDEGLAKLERVQRDTGLPVITDVHESAQCAAAADVVDALQIPAFLCRQTDLLIAAGSTGLPVNVKKGQWMPPEGMAGAVEKVRSGGAAALAVTERGSFFGYGDLVVDMRNFARLREACLAPVVFDATHSVQQPGKGVEGASGGLREHIPALLLAAAAAGCDGFFLETHPHPERAPSDGANMWPLDTFEVLLDRALQVWRSARETPA